MKSLNDVETKQLRVQETLLSKRVYEIITDWIVNGVLEAGCKLSESEISEKLGVSRMPVREALRMLEKNGFVEFTPYQGCSVKVLTLDRLKETYILREELESFACRQAALHITDEEIEELEKFQTLIEEKAADGFNGKEAYEVNRIFHMTMYNAAKLPTLIDFIERLWNAIAYYRLKVAHEESYLPKMKNEHRLYIKLLKEHDADQLAQKVRDNLQYHCEKAILDYDKYILK